MYHYSPISFWSGPMTELNRDMNLYFLSLLKNLNRGRNLSASFKSFLNDSDSYNSLSGNSFALPSWGEKKFQPLLGIFTVITLLIVWPLLELLLYNTGLWLFFPVNSSTHLKAANPLRNSCGHYYYNNSKHISYLVFQSTCFKRCFTLSKQRW